MKFKKVTLVMLILLVFLTIGAVSASTDTDDLATPDVNGDTTNNPDDTGTSDNSPTILKETQKTTTGNEDDSESEEENEYDVTTTTVENWEENRDTNFINISTPKDADKTNRIIVTKVSYDENGEIDEDNRPLLFNKSLDDAFWSADKKIESDDKISYLLSINNLDNFNDHLYEGFIPLKFRVTDSTEETEFLNKNIEFCDEEGNFIAREEDEEGDDDDEGPVSFRGPGEEDNEFDISESEVIIGYLHVNTDVDEDITLTIKKNGKLFKEIKTSALLDDREEKTNKYLYPIKLNLKEVTDKSVLEFYWLDDMECFYAIQINENKAIFHEYEDFEGIEFYIFYGNLTKGDENDYGMGPCPNGNFIRLEIPDSENIIEGTLTAIDENNNTILNKKLTELKKNYIYGILGYEYVIDLDDSIVKEDLTKGGNVTYTFSYGDKTVSKKRYTEGDFVYMINTLDDMGDYFNVKFADETLTAEEEVALSIINIDANPMNIGDIGHGYFTVYVDGKKVENFEIDVHDLIGQNPHETNITLSQLGITQKGTYNIKVTHTPKKYVDDEGEEHLFYSYPNIELEILNKDITFKTSVSPSPENNGTNGSGQQGQGGQGTGTTTGQTTTPPAQTNTPQQQSSTSTTNTANQITITPSKTTTTVSKKAKKLVLTTKLKLGNKIAKGKTVKFLIKGKKYKATTNKNGIAKLKLNKKQLKRILRNTKPGQKIKYKLQYGKTTKTGYIKIKK